MRLNTEGEQGECDSGAQAPSVVSQSWLCFRFLEIIHVFVLDICSAVMGAAMFLPKPREDKQQFNFFFLFRLNVSIYLFISCIYLFIFSIIFINGTVYVHISVSVPFYYFTDLNFLGKKKFFFYPNETLS